MLRLESGAYQPRVGGNVGSIFTPQEIDSYQHKNTRGGDYFWQMLYRERNRVERFFNKLKQFRRIATRYDKLAKTFLAAVHLVAAFLIIRNS